MAGFALLPAATASADVVVADDQIVNGKQCIGVLCADGEAFSSIGLRVKSADTPGVSLVQTNDGGFTAQTWDVGGNEANFFVRDLTGGSKLPLRIRPGAPTSGVDIRATGDVNTAGIVQQNTAPTGLTVTGDVDGSAVLTALRTLPIKRYTINVDSGAAPHLAPASAAFRSAFTLGGSDDTLAPGDVAAVALAAVKELDARVSTISLTPGPQGQQGATGATGAIGATGPAGASGTTADAASLKLAQEKIAALQASNRKLARNLKGLRRQVRKLVAAS